MRLAWARRDLLVLLAPRAFLVLKDPRATTATRDRLVLRDPKVPQVPPARLAHLACKVPQASTVSTAMRALPVPQDHRALKGHREFQERRVPPAHKVRRVLTATKGLKVPRDRLGPLAPLVPPARQSS